MEKIRKIFVVILIIFVAISCSVVYAADEPNITMNITGDTTIKNDQKTLVLTLSLGSFTNVESGKVLGFEGFLDCTEGIFKSIKLEGQNGWTIEYKDTTKKLIGSTDVSKPNVTIGTITFELNEDIDVTSPKIEFKNILLTDGTNDFTINKTFELTFESTGEQQGTGSGSVEDTQQGTGGESDETQQGEQQKQSTEQEQKQQEQEGIELSGDTTQGTGEQNSNNDQTTSSEKETEQKISTTSVTATDSSKSSSESSSKSSSEASSESSKLPKAGLNNKLLILSTIGILFVVAVMLKAKLKKMRF